MSEFEKEHPLMNEVARTFMQLYEHKQNEQVRQALLKKNILVQEQIANRQAREEGR